MAAQPNSHTVNDLLDPNTPSKAQDQLTQPSLAKKFLESLPVVKLEDLPENCESCHICQELFDDPDPEVMVESPVKLPCNHTMGSTCLEKWLDGNNLGSTRLEKWLEGNNTCPMCRADLYELIRARMAELFEIPRELEGEEDGEVAARYGAYFFSSQREILRYAMNTNEDWAEEAASRRLGRMSRFDRENL